jgi:hypothetical protein
VNRPSVASCAPAEIGNISDSTERHLPGGEPRTPFHFLGLRRAVSFPVRQGRVPSFLEVDVKSGNSTLFDLNPFLSLLTIDDDKFNQAF